MRPLSFLLLLTALWTTLSCEMSTAIEAEHEPVLQIDAVFYADEPLPVIRVRQSFRTARTDGKFLVDTEALEISGADIELYRNGKSVSITEESPGHYQPDAGIIAAAGDRFEIRVHKNGMNAKATALVPDYPVNRIDINPATEVDAIWGAAEVSFRFHFPFMPPFTAIRVYSEEDSSLVQSRNLRYQTHSAGDYAGEEELAVTHTSRFQFPFEEEDVGLKKTFRLPFYVDVVMPEAIYETWHRHRTNYGGVTPLTVTNVEGGVGLFFGTVRLHLELETELTVHFVNPY